MANQFFPVFPASGIWYVWGPLRWPTGVDDSIRIGVDFAMSPLGLAIGNNANANRYDFGHKCDLKKMRKKRVSRVRAYLCIGGIDNPGGTEHGPVT